MIVKWGWLAGGGLESDFQVETSQYWPLDHHLMRLAIVNKVLTELQVRAACGPAAEAIFHDGHASAKCCLDSREVRVPHAKRTV